MDIKNSRIGKESLENNMSTTLKFRCAAMQVAAGIGFFLLGWFMAMIWLWLTFGWDIENSEVCYCNKYIKTVVCILLIFLPGLVYVMSGFIRKEAGHVYRIVGVLAGLIIPILIAWILLRNLQIPAMRY